MIRHVIVYPGERLFVNITGEFDRDYQLVLLDAQASPIFSLSPSSRLVIVALPLDVELGDCTLQLRSSKWVLDSLSIEISDRLVALSTRAQIQASLRYADSLEALQGSAPNVQKAFRAASVAEHLYVRSGDASLARDTWLELSHALRGLGILDAACTAEQRAHRIPAASNRSILSSAADTSGNAEANEASTGLEAGDLAEKMANQALFKVGLDFDRLRTRLAQLVALGIECNFLTLPEIVTCFPRGLLEQVHIEPIVSAFEELGIRVYDSNPNSDQFLLNNAIPTIEELWATHKLPEDTGTIASNLNAMQPEVFPELDRIAHHGNEAEIEASVFLRNAQDQMLSAFAECPIALDRLLKIRDAIDSEETPVYRLICAIAHAKINTNRVLGNQRKLPDEAIPGEDDDFDLELSDSPGFKNSILNRLDSIDILHNRLIMMANFAAFRPQGEDYLATKQALKKQLLELRFTAGVMSNVLEVLLAKMYKVRSTETRIMRLCVDKAHMPIAHYREFVAGNETTTNWLNSELASGRHYSSLLTQTVPEIEEALKQLHALEREIGIPLNHFKSIYKDLSAMPYQIFEAQNRLTKPIEKQVESRLMNLTGYGLQRLDLGQIARFSVREAARNFDYRHSKSFSTYAMMWAKAVFFSSLSRNMRIIRDKMANKVLHDCIDAHGDTSIFVSRLPSEAVTYLRSSICEIVVREFKLQTRNMKRWQSTEAVHVETMGHTTTQNGIAPGAAPLFESLFSREDIDTSKSMRVLSISTKK